MYRYLCEHILLFLGKQLQVGLLDHVLSLYYCCILLTSPFVSLGLVSPHCSPFSTRPPEFLRHKSNSQIETGCELAQQQTLDVRLAPAGF